MSIGFEVKTEKLAIEGGLPVRNVELALEPEITEEEIQAALEVLNNKQLSPLDSLCN